MKSFLFITILILAHWCISAQKVNDTFPIAIISNEEVKMSIYLPDAEKGYYRGTRFDWSGVICSFTYEGHEYFGEWFKTHNPVSSSDITGPVNGYLSPGLGYEEAGAGGEFIRIGVGVLEQPDLGNYQTFKTYKLIDPGKWQIKKGKNWIEFTHQVNRNSGWGYKYSKRIELMADEPGFRISYELKNTGKKLIETDQFNHNFFIIDKGKPDTDYKLRFPFDCVLSDNPKNTKQNIVELKNRELVFKNKIEYDVWVNLSGFNDEIKDNQFELTNTKSGAGIRVNGNIPLSAFNFWANTITICPETFIKLKLAPAEKLSWNFDYTAFLTTN